jgi:hypothetical protein
LAKVKVKLAPGRIAFFHQETGIHLDLESPVAEVPGDADLTGIKTALKVGTLVLVEGSIEDLEQDDTKEDTANDSEKKAVKEDQPSKEEDKVKDDTSDENFTEEELEELTVKELKDLARDMDLSGYSSMVKDDLIELILGE